MQSTTENADPVFQIVNNVLTQVFGEKAVQIIYQHLENRYALQRNEFADKIDLFAKGLENLLHANASYIERRILKDFCNSYGTAEQLELVHMSGTCDFATSMRIAMQKA